MQTLWQWGWPQARPSPPAPREAFSAKRSRGRALPADERALQDSELPPSQPAVDRTGQRRRGGCGSSRPRAGRAAFGAVTTRGLRGPSPARRAPLTCALPVRSRASARAYRALPRALRWAHDAVSTSMAPTRPRAAGSRRLLQALGIDGHLRGSREQRVVQRQHRHLLALSLFPLVSNFQSCIK